MNIKRYMYIVLILLVLVSLSAVSAADDTASDIVSADDEEIILDESIDEDASVANDNYDEEILSGENDLEPLGDDASTYSALSTEIGSGGNIELQHKYYTYDSGATIKITTPDSVIDGKGAVIDMAESNIQAFYVSASGVTIKNLTIKNANYDNYGGAIYFSASGTVTNCNFTNNKATGDNGEGGAIYFSASGTVTNCNFTNNTAFEDGGAIYFWENGEVTNCNFTNNTAFDDGGAINFWENGEVTNCNFTNNTASDGGGAVNFYDYGTVTNCNFTNNTATCGGAVSFLVKGNVTNCNFVKNSGYGGAIFSNGWYTSADTCIFKTSTDTTINTVNSPPTLKVDNFTTVFNSSEKIAFDLRTNVSSLPVSDGNILISVYYKNNDSFVGNYSCLSGEGWTVDLPGGSYYAIYNTEYAGFEAINRTITVNKANAEISPKTNAINLYVGDSSQVEYTLNPASASGDITFKSSNPNVVTVDSTGKIKAVGAGTATITISLTSEEYDAQDATVTITVSKKDTKIAASAKSFKYEDKTKKYTVTLKDNQGNVLKNKKVTLKVNGKTYTATTNSKGVATFKLSKLTKKGTFTAVVTYAGDKTYNKVTKKAKITVKAPAKKKTVWKTISKGSKDKNTVKKIQKALKKNGYYLNYKGRYLKVDGIYHKYTEMAVKQYQKAKGLKVTGKVDEKTAKKLKLI